MNWDEVMIDNACTICFINSQTRYLQYCPRKTADLIICCLSQSKLNLIKENEIGRVLIHYPRNYDLQYNSL